MSVHNKQIKGTKSETVGLNWWQYWIGHCWMTGWQSIRMNFRVWADLMGSNYENWNILSSVDDPEAECLEWFWVGLNEDDVYPKEFLEYLMQMADDVMNGRVETYSWEGIEEELRGVPDEELD